MNTPFLGEYQLFALTIGNAVTTLEISFFSPNFAAPVLIIYEALEDGLKVLC